MRIQTQSGPRMKWRTYLVVTLLALCTALPARAHLGPPYPIMQDRKIGPFTVSVWANPDTGLGSFFVVIDPPKGGAVPSDMKVQVAVQPVSGRLPEKAYGAWREKLRDRVEFKADVPFDKEEEWRIRILLTSQQGTGEADTNVQVTPPGLGRWDLLLFALPFVGVGVLWFKAMKTKLGRRKAARKQTQRTAM
ncbi:MAG: hypothetical protein JO300_04845 [Silvibacterium sp.]|nr:hypothetical protein [Silvibacterium sp.]MBV8436603.1 hypothetical protein [Silvibacterium sp.]